MLATTPSGSWPMRSVMPPSSNTVSSRVARLDLGEEEVDPAEQAVQLVARLRDRLADLAASASRRASRARRTTRGAKARDAGLRARRAASPPSAGCAARARAAFAATLAASSAGDFGDRRAGGGVGDLERRGHAVLGGARAAARKSSSSGVSSRVPSPRRWNSGCHCTAAMKLPPGRRIASIMPSAGQRASTTKPGARSLMAWWWTLLTTGRVDARDRSRPAACPATNSTAWKLRS